MEQWKRLIFLALAFVSVLFFMGLIFVFGEANADISDFFDKRAIDPKWTTADLAAGGGTVTEAGGFLVLTLPAAGVSYPVAAQASAFVSSSFDIRAKLRFDTALAADQLHWFSATEDYSTFADAIVIQYDGTFIRRVDYNGGVDSNGATANIGYVRDIYVRIYGSGDDSFVAYYKLSPGATWAQLAVPAIVWTPTQPFDIAFVAIESTGGNSTQKADWIVLDSEHPGWPHLIKASLWWK